MTKRPNKPWRSKLIATSLLLGAIGFFGPLFGSRMPTDFEWPAGYKGNVWQASDGHHVVPHRAASRLQIYTEEWRFVRAMNLRGTGGRFRICLREDDTIIVMRTKNRRDVQYEFTLDGVLVETETYSLRHEDLFSPESSIGCLPDAGRFVYVPTKPWLFPFSTPVIGWFFWMAGCVGLYVSWRRRRLPASSHPPSR